VNIETIKNSPKVLILWPLNRMPSKQTRYSIEYRLDSHSPVVRGSARNDGPWFVSEPVR
jgi:hypothetical protein